MQALPFHHRAGAAQGLPLGVLARLTALTTPVSLSVPVAPKLPVCKDTAVPLGVRPRCTDYGVDGGASDDRMPMTNAYWPPPTGSAPAEEPDVPHQSSQKTALPLRTEAGGKHNGGLVLVGSGSIPAPVPAAEEPTTATAPSLSPSAHEPPTLVLPRLQRLFGPPPDGLLLGSLLPPIPLPALASVLRSDGAGSCTGSERDGSAASSLPAAGSQSLAAGEQGTAKALSATTQTVEFASWAGGEVLMGSGAARRRARLPRVVAPHLTSLTVDLGGLARN
jgi:hypothetical protein